MGTDQSFCVSCSASNEQEHQEQWYETMTDYTILLRAKEFGYVDAFDRIIRDWRTHVLPVCDPLSID